MEGEKVTKAESLRASIKRKLRRSFRMERKNSNTSTHSNEENSSWYHYENAPDEADLIDRLRREDVEEEETWADDEEDDDVECTALVQMEPHVKKILQESWQHLQDRIASLGVVTFLSLFNVQPDTLDSYLSAEDIEALKAANQDKLYMEKLRVHPLRILSVVEKTMHRMEDRQRCLKMLRLYGKRHQRYGITAELFPYMAKGFTRAIEPTLTEIDAWNEEVCEAWKSLFALITFGMQRGLNKPADVATVVVTQPTEDNSIQTLD